MLSGRRAEVDQVLAQIIAMLPADTAARLDVAAGLQAYIAQDAVGAERAAQRQREDAEAVRAVALEEENSRLRTELRKVEAIRETLQSISSISVFDEGGVSGGAGGSGAGAANGYHRLLSAAAVRGGSPDVMGLMSASPLRMPRSRSSPRMDGGGGGGGGGGGIQLDQSRSHGSLVAAIDRRIVDGRNTHYRSPAATPAPSVAGANARALPSSPLQSGKVFFAECRTRLDQGTYFHFISDIKDLKVNKITRDEVLTNANAHFAPDNLDLVDKLKRLLCAEGDE